MEADLHLDRSISGRLLLAILLTAVTLVAEVVGGLMTNSLALLSDAAHVFLDLFALLLSLGAIRLAQAPASETRSFGWHRAEVFASFINGITVVLMAVGICYEAWGRLLQPEPVKTLPMLAIAALGLVMNLLAANGLHAHSHDDLNVQSAFLHVVGDAAASVAVIIGGVVMYFTGWYLLDALLSVGIGLLILWGAWRVVRDAVHILLEGVPRGLSVSEVAAAIGEVPGVSDVHHLNLWAICSHILALSAHVTVQPERRGEQERILRRIEKLLQERFHITHTTLQLNCAGCAPGQMLKELRHKARHGGHGHAHGPGHRHGAACRHDHPHEHGEGAAPHGHDDPFEE